MPAKAFRQQHPKQKPRQPHRERQGELTYTMPSQVAQMALSLVEPKRGYTTVEEFLHRFRFEENKKRSVQRYLAALRVGVFNGDFHSAVLRLEDKNGKDVPVDEDRGLKSIPETRIARVKLVTLRGQDIDETALQELLPIYMSYAVLRYLDGIISRDKVSELWRVLAEKAGPSQSLMLTNFEQKFFSVPYAPKRYDTPELQETLTVALDALLRQHVLRVYYYGLKGMGKDHRFEPYTLAMYKGGLYLLGKSDRHDGAPFCLAIERIDSIEKDLDGDGLPVTFRTPADYSPEKHFQGVFGLIEGDTTHVELEIQNEETEARLRERTIHPSQKFRHSAEVGADGYRKAIVSMDVRGTTELAMWVLGHGPYLRVLEPASLRGQVERFLADSLDLYSIGRSRTA